MSQLYKVEEKSLEQSIRGKMNEPRNVAVFIARKHTGLCLEDIGCEFRLTKYSSVSSIVCRIEKQLSKSSNLHKHVNKITLEILKSQAKT